MDGVALEFGSVPNGENLVVVVEIKEAVQKTSRAIYFGMSEPFKLEAGKHVEVTVSLKLSSVPTSREGTDAAGTVLVVRQAGDGEYEPLTHVNTSLIDLSIASPKSCESPCLILVSNTSEFIESESNVQDLASLERYGERYIWSDWDLNFGLINADEEGVKTIYVKYRNPQAYDSEAFTAQITLDTTKPLLSKTSGVISPIFANGQSEIVIILNPTEPLASSPILHVSPVDPGFDEGRKIGESYVFSYAVDDKADEGVSYTFKIDLVDLAGNESKALAIEDLLQIDPYLPEILNLTLTDGETETEQFSAVDEYKSLVVEFDVDEDLLKAEALLQVVLQTSSTDIELTCEADEALHYTCPYTVQGDEGHGAHNLTVLTMDAAGNSDFATTTASFDFQPPRLIGTPYFERCDNYLPARLDTNKLWVKGYEESDDEGLPTYCQNTYGCSYDLTDDVCGDGVIRVSFGISEPVREEAAVRKVEIDPAHAFSIDELYSDQNSVVAVYKPDNTEPESIEEAVPVPVFTVLEDLLGNSATIELGELLFDFDEPAQAKVDTQDAVTYRRVPYGSDATEGQPRFTLSGLVGSVEADSTVIAYNPSPPSKIGQGLSKADGSFDEFELDPSNRPEIELVVKDRAGNISTKTRVREIDWTLSLGYKLPGSTVENPTVLKTTSYFHPTLAQDPLIVREPSEVDLARLRLKDGQALIHRAKADWRARKPGGDPPSGRFNHAMAYDAARGKLVLFGGLNVDDCGEGVERRCAWTWEWDSEAGTWMDVTPDGDKPFARFIHSMTYDAVRGKVLLVGGYNIDGCGEGSGEYCAWTWEWDGEAGTWTNVTPEGDKPMGREYSGMAYDSARGKSILFGGFNGYGCGEDAGGYCSLTWEWDGMAGTWRDVTPEGDKPSPRSGPAMAYDTVRGKVVLFGGWNDDDCGEGAGQRCAWTWEWDGESETWTRIMVDGDKPRARSSHSMAYDAVSGKVVLFSGYNGEGCGEGTEEYCSRTWEWDGVSATWTKVAKLGDQPSPRSIHAMTFGGMHGKVILLGGLNNDGCDEGAGDNCSWLWEWDGEAGTWMKFKPDGGPPIARSAHSMAYDESWKKIVLFGGFHLGGCAEGTGDFCSWTWEWDGEVGTWTDVTPEGAKPSARSGVAMVYDIEQEKTVLFGGQNWIDLCGEGAGDSCDWTWLWDSNEGTWTKVTPVGDKPTARAFHAMAYDEGRGTVLLFGGSDDEPDCGEDGGEYCDWTWEWDGEMETWTKITPVGESPTGRDCHAMAYDERRGKVVLFGGRNDDGCGEGMENLCAWTWEWDGEVGTWTKHRPTRDTPTARESHSMVYDATREKIVLFGGWNVNGCEEGMGEPCAWTWEWDGEVKKWTEVTPEGDKPKARNSHAMVYDRLQGKVVLYGGGSLSGCGDEGGGYCSWIWEWDGAADKTLAALWEIPFAYSQAEEADVLQISAFGYAGGVGYPADNPEEGAQLMVWDTHHADWFWESSPGWRLLAENSDGIEAPNTPDLLEWSNDDPEQIRHFFFGDEQNLNLAIIPSAVNGTATDLGKIAIDYVEATVKYRLPAETEIDCVNGEDDDADALTDCEDDDCADDPACATEGDGDSDSEYEIDEFE